MPDSIARDVAVLVGSLRTGSFNRMLAEALIELAPDTLRLTEVALRPLPFYDPDLEQSPPSEWTAFRQRIARANAVLFVTPEYNRGVPAVLKNAVDVGSRPLTTNVWKGKPAAVVSASPGAIGGFGANHQLRQSLVTLGVATMPTPEAYVGGVDKLFDADGHLVNESTRAFLRKLLGAFDDWTTRNVPR